MSEGTIVGLIQRPAYDAFLAYQLDWSQSVDTYLRSWPAPEQGEGASRPAPVWALILKSAARPHVSACRVMFDRLTLYLGANFSCESVNLWRLYDVHCKRYSGITSPWWWSSSWWRRRRLQCHKRTLFDWPLHLTDFPAVPLPWFGEHSPHRGLTRLVRFVTVPPSAHSASVRLSHWPPPPPCAT